VDNNVTRGLVRTSRNGIVTDHDHNRDSKNHSYLESKVANNNINKATKEGFSQTEVSGDLEQEIVLGQYLEHKLGPDLKELKVKISPTDNHLSETHGNVASKQQYSNFNPVPEIFIVEYEQEEEII